jgi:Family of unknown function (DUF5718)
VIEIELSTLRDVFGFGVAGNFAGHLEQAGEAAELAGVGDLGAAAPKGIFPFYVPGARTFLGEFPFSNRRIAKPHAPEPVNLQIEPEAGLICQVDYEPSGKVERLMPVALGAFNDLSVRRAGASKISEKKNWGADSKGVAEAFLPVTDLGPHGPTQSLRIACFLRRGDETHAYGVDSAVAAYSYYGSQLLNWMVDRLNHQVGTGDSPLEPVGEYLDACGRPARAIIAIGATRYTDFGESTFLEAGDESIVIVYDGAVHTQEQVAQAIAERTDGRLPGASVLRQVVYELGA